MKKVLLTLVLCGLVGIASAQIRFGVSAGLNVSSQTGDVEDAKFTPGFQVGGVLDYALTSSLSIIPELQFTQKGVKYEYGSSSTTTTLNYLALPINVAYKIDAGNDQTIFPFAGVYVGYALFGKTGDNDIKFGSEVGEMKPFDFGLNIGLGYAYQSIFFKLQYNHGLANLSNSSISAYNNQNIAVSVGYMF